MSDDTEAKNTPDYVVYGDDGKATITLVGFATIDGVKTSAVSMREPTVLDQLISEGTKGTDLEKEVRIFANLCDLAPDSIKGLSVRNYKRLVVTYLGFVD